MHGRWVGLALLAGLALATASPLSAQQNQPAPVQPSSMDQDEGPVVVPPRPAEPPRRHSKTVPLQRDPNLNVEDQLAPSQIKQPIPAAVDTPGSAGARRVRTANHGPWAAAKPRTGRHSRPAAFRIVACSGVFGRDSSQLKLARAFRPRNVAFNQVDTAIGNKVMATVLFARNPKRRLEVWWSKPSSRSEIRLIVINAKSGWAAPGGLHLGLTLPEVEALNHKPFKLLGFNRNDLAALTDWQGGALAGIPGGCKIGINLRPDPKTPLAALAALPSDREFTSADAAIRATLPKVSEILIGY